MYGWDILCGVSKVTLFALGLLQIISFRAACICMCPVNRTIHFNHSFLSVAMWWKASQGLFAFEVLPMLISFITVCVFSIISNPYFLSVSVWWKASQGLFAFGVLLILIAFLTACVYLCSACCKAFFSIVHFINGLLVFACELGEQSGWLLADNIVKYIVVPL